MRLKTVIKLGTIISVALFCIAVGFYAFMRLDMSGRNRDANLFTLVPSHTVCVLESEDINRFFNVLPSLNYNREMEHLRFSGLFNLIMSSLNYYTTTNGHGLSNQMSRILVSFHESSASYEQVIYFHTSDADEKLLADMLQEYAPSDFLLKEEVYRGKRMVIYPLGNEEYLVSYAESGFLVVSLQKRLIEQVIDAQSDHTSLADNPVFSKILERQKSRSFLTLYGRASAIPFLKVEDDCWSEYDFHMNSDVLYLTGDTYMPDSCSCLDSLPFHLHGLSQEWMDSVLITADRDSLQWYMDKAYEEDPSTRSLFNQCVANLSGDASFTIVVDMQKVLEKPFAFTDYLPSFMVDNAFLLRPFIFSGQYSLTDDRLSHIWVFTYKD